MVWNDNRSRDRDRHKAAAEAMKDDASASVWRAIAAERRDQADRTAAAASRMGWRGADTGRGPDAR